MSAPLSSRHHTIRRDSNLQPSIGLLCCLLLSFTSPLASSSIDSGPGDREAATDDLYREILRDEAIARLNELGKVSDADGYLERTFMSPASVRAGDMIRLWMEDAGLRTWVDGIGNVHGRVEGMNTNGTPALLIGSHLDTVIDAGKFDGSLGVISAISALKSLKSIGKLEELERPVEVIAFSDEEGVRFQSTFLGSAAMAGILPSAALQTSDKSGTTLRDVLEKSSTDTAEGRLKDLKYDPAAVWGYVEVHIEQGPVLEWSGFPIGVVKGIAGQTRLKVTVRGSQGHAGTVPMPLRQDPMAASAELIVFLENLCKQPRAFVYCDGPCNEEILESLASSLVCTVGEISTWPSASNVIPGQVTFTVDLRAIDDKGREAVLYQLSSRMYQICDKRSVSCTIEQKHNANAVISDPELTRQLKSSTQAAVGRMTGNFRVDVPIIMSGAGHDAMAMSHLTKVGMVFVRCRGGISHSPDESVLDDDVWAAGLTLMEFLKTQLVKTRSL